MDSAGAETPGTVCAEQARDQRIAGRPQGAAARASTSRRGTGNGKDRRAQAPSCLRAPVYRVTACRVLGVAVARWF
ncbi:hypothetical protein Aglo01_44210 [Actinokineospora globicatena]|nr:hypothetical protein Aglo01_44210 [Actinokineospora globicatena]GLW86769.1 hypothetical protein Aglo02_44080 [Actinokineospora globicatena]